MGGLQLLIVLETSDDSRTDAIYFGEVINRFFLYIDKNSGYEVNTSIIPLSGKQNYKNKKIVNRIKNSIKMFKTYTRGETVVIYCIDTDSVEQVYKRSSFFYNVSTFCKENGFELAWFCKNAENVFLGVEPTTLENKTEAALEFSRNGDINKIKETNLVKEKIELNCSNIVAILDKYLKRK